MVNCSTGGGSAAAVVPRRALGASILLQPMTGSRASTGVIVLTRLARVTGVHDARLASLAPLLGNVVLPAGIIEIAGTDTIKLVRQIQPVRPALPRHDLGLLQAGGTTSASATSSLTSAPLGSTRSRWRRRAFQGPPHARASGVLTTCGFKVPLGMHVLIYP